MNLKQIIANAQKTDDCGHLINNTVNLSVKRDALSDALSDAQVLTDRQTNLQKALSRTENMNEKNISGQFINRAIKRTVGNVSDAKKARGASDILRSATNISKYSAEFDAGFEMLSQNTGITRDQLRQAIATNKNEVNVLIDNRYKNDCSKYLHVKALPHIIACCVNLAKPKTLKSNYFALYAEYLSGFEPDEMFSRDAWVKYHNTALNVNNGTAIVSQFQSIIRAFNLGTISENSKLMSLNEKGLKFFEYINKNCQFK